MSPDGDVRWVVDRTVILPTVDGQRTLTQGMIFDITDRKRAEQELSHRANHDALTGLPNRDQFRAALDEAIVRARKHGRAVGAMYVDLDDFKVVNDGFGHDVGDEVLVAVADRLRGATRASDLVGRDGGDEFLVLLPDLPASIEGPRARPRRRRAGSGRCWWSLWPPRPPSCPSARAWASASSPSTPQTRRRS